MPRCSKILEHDGHLFESQSVAGDDGQSSSKEFLITNERCTSQLPSIAARFHASFFSLKFRNRRWKRSGSFSN